MIKTVRVITPRIPGTATLQLSSRPGLVYMWLCVSLAAARLPPCRYVTQIGRFSSGGHKGFFWNTEIEVHQFNICFLLVKAQTHLTKADKKGKLWKRNLSLEVYFGWFHRSPVFQHILFLRFQIMKTKETKFLNKGCLQPCNRNRNKT